MKEAGHKAFLAVYLALEVFMTAIAVETRDLGVWIVLPWKYLLLGHGLYFLAMRPPPLLPVEPVAPVPQVPEPALEAAMEDAGRRVQAAKPQRVEKVSVDLTRPETLLDCCFTCGNRFQCYKGQAELMEKWSYLCEDFQRDDALEHGEVVDVGRRK